LHPVSTSFNNGNTGLGKYLKTKQLKSTDFNQFQYSLEIAWGARGRQFKSARPDHSKLQISYTASVTFCFAELPTTSTPMIRCNLISRRARKAVQICPSRPLQIIDIQGVGYGFSRALAVFILSDVVVFEAEESSKLILLIFSVAFLGINPVPRHN